jgi:2-dehydropantoate 2-reductase
LIAALPARSVISSVVYIGVARIAPGVIRWTSGNKFVIGEPAGRPSERTERVAAVLRQAGFDVTIADDIRAEIWTKLIGNAAFNPLSAIARARIDELMNDPGLGRIALASMREVAAVAVAVGAPSGMDIEKRFAINAELGPFRTSMPAALSSWAGSSMRWSRSAHASACRRQ